MPPPKKPRCRDAPWFFLAREGPSARPEWARNRRWTMPCNVSVRGAFQLTPSARRATYDILMTSRRAQISIHALREEGDLQREKPDLYMEISIHALREEGDLLLNADLSLIVDFNPRPPRGGRRNAIKQVKIPYQFQSTPSARRATLHAVNKLRLLVISIHALREESDDSVAPITSFTKISIHALREEGDGNVPCRRCRSIYFNPRPPRGGRLPWHPP